MTQPQQPTEATHPDMFRYYTNGRALQGVMQYQDIMMCIAFCYADLLQFEQAIAT